MNRKMKKYRYIISAVAAVAAVSVILSACASGKESNASSPHRVFRLRLRKAPEARREI